MIKEESLKNNNIVDEKSHIILKELLKKKGKTGIVFIETINRAVCLKCNSIFTRTKLNKNDGCPNCNNKKENFERLRRSNYFHIHSVFSYYYNFEIIDNKAKMSLLKIIADKNSEKIVVDKEHLFDFNDKTLKLFINEIVEDIENLRWYDLSEEESLAILLSSEILLSKYKKEDLEDLATILSLQQVGSSLYLQTLIDIYVRLITLDLDLKEWNRYMYLLMIFSIEELENMNVETPTDFKKYLPEQTLRAISKPIIIRNINNLKTNNERIKEVMEMESLFTAQSKKVSNDYIKNKVLLKQEIGTLVNVLISGYIFERYRRNDIVLYYKKAKEFILNLELNISNIDYHVLNVLFTTVNNNQLDIEYAATLLLDTVELIEKYNSKYPLNRVVIKAEEDIYKVISLNLVSKLLYLKNLNKDDIQKINLIDLELDKSKTLDNFLVQ